MLLVALVAAALAAALHVYFFVLESLRWTDAKTRRIFGIRSEEEARVTKPLALNQGYYNLFLAVATVAGIVLLALDHRPVGDTLVYAGCGIMLGAAVVLFVSNRRMLRAAVIQGGPPLVAIIALSFEILLHP